MSRDAVIVSTARTPIGRAYKGGFNATPGATLGSFSFQAAVERSGIDAAEIDDVVWGSVLNQGTQAGNIGRQVALRGGAPVSGSPPSRGAPVPSSMRPVKWSPTGT